MRRLSKTKAIRDERSATQKGAFRGYLPLEWYLDALLTSLSQANAHEVSRTLSPEGCALGPSPEAINDYFNLNFLCTVHGLSCS